MKPAVYWVAACALAVASLAIVVGSPSLSSPCGHGFFLVGARCCVTRDASRCLGERSCPAPLVSSTTGCTQPPSRVLVPETSLLIGPSDWEAEGRVPPRTVRVDRFWIDAFELTDEEGRGRGGLTRDEARALCTQKSGRLPTEDEWIAAAAGPSPRRYPWGDTGAVCRRGAWGIEKGPCAFGASGPDTAGAHADGDTPSGIHDLAGNVAEWVEAASPEGPGVARGGSYRAVLATELRTWSRAEVSATLRHPWVGARCAYDAAGP